MEPERYGATYPGHKFPMRDWILTTAGSYTSLSPLIFLEDKTMCYSNVVELLSSQDIVQLYVHFLKCVEFLDCNFTCLPFETTFSSMC